MRTLRSSQWELAMVSDTWIAAVDDERLEQEERHTRWTCRKALIGFDDGSIQGEGNQIWRRPQERA